MFFDLASNETTTLDRLATHPAGAYVELAAGHTPVAGSDYLGLKPVPVDVALGQTIVEMLPPIGVFSVADATIVGASHAFKDSRIVSGKTTMHHYLTDAYGRGWVSIDVPKAPRALVLDQPVTMVTNCKSDQHGHFLLECLPKLFVAKLMHEQGLRHPLLLPAGLPRYVKEMALAVEPGFTIIEYDPAKDVVAAPQLMLPTSCQVDFAFHAAYVDFIRGFAASLGNPARIATPERLYLSRSQLGDKERGRRFLRNQAEIETVAERLGCVVVHPQWLRWRDQVALFAGAKLLVGEYGSALHNAIFSPAGTRVLAINWLNTVQQRIAQSFGHELGFVMPDDGTPRDGPTPSQDPGFDVDPAEFAAALENAATGHARVAPTLLFDPAWYLARNPDVAANGAAPLLHYKQFGWKERRAPSRHFDANRYLEDNPDIAENGAEPVWHYLHIGRFEGRPIYPVSD